MAIMIYLLREYANEEFDLAKAMMMALIHDIVEIDAGDTYAYDKANLKTQKEREKKAANRIYGLLPDEQKDELKALFEEFEEGQTPEAKFARVMDNFQPLESYEQGADYLGVGAIYPTTTKVKTVLTSTETLDAICKAVPIPVNAIGGLNKNNVQILEGIDIAGFCVVSAIMKADDPKAETKNLLTLAKELKKQ